MDMFGIADDGADDNCSGDSR